MATDDEILESLKRIERLLAQQTKEMQIHLLEVAKAIRDKK